MKKLLTTALACTLLLAGCGSKNDKEISENTGKEKFRVGMECGYVPFNWQTNTQTDTSVSLGGAGYCDGYDVMMARKIAEKLDMEIEVKKIEWKGLQPALDSGDIDAIIAGMTANDEREAGVDFTTPYYESEMVMIVRKDDKAAKFDDIQQFKGLNVVGQQGTNYDDVIDQIKDVKHATPKASYPEMVLALQNKEVDAITAELPVAEGVTSTNKDLAIVKFAEGKGFKADTSVSIGLKEGSRDSEYFKKVQAALDSISQDERKELMKTATNAAPAN